MRDPTGKRPKDRPLDYYLPPPPRLDQLQQSSWQPPGVSPSNLSISQASGKFLSAADMYRQDSTPYGYPAQQPHPYANPRVVQAPRPAQSAHPLASPPMPQPPQPPTSTMADPRPPPAFLRTNSQVDIRRSPSGAPLAFPSSTSPPPRQGSHVQTDFMRPPTSEHIRGVANEGPNIEERRPSLGSPRPRQRTISQPNRDYRRPTQSPPPLPQQDPYSLISPRRANYPNPDDPFSVVGPRGHQLKQTKSNTTEGSHKGSSHACVSL